MRTELDSFQLGTFIHITLFILKNFVTIPVNTREKTLTDSYLNIIYKYIVTFFDQADPETKPLSICFFEVFRITQIQWLSLINYLSLISNFIVCKYQNRIQNVLPTGRN